MVAGGDRVSGNRSVNFRSLGVNQLKPHISSDRVNRIGQKREVQVYQMITTDTVESKVLEIQARKKAMIDQVSVGCLAKNDGTDNCNWEGFFCHGRS